MYLYMVVPVLVVILLLFLLRLHPSRPTVGLFHPYADAGGGGERVLWHAISAMIVKWPKVRYVVYTGERDRTPYQILNKVKNRFGIEIPNDKIQFVFLRFRWLVESSTWPRFTLAGQMLGSILLGIEAACHCRPHVFFDTMGYAFTYPLFRWLLGRSVLAYVHYPIVSTDMLRLVASGQSTYNNKTRITRSRFLTSLKIRYYRILASLYGFVGRRANVIMVNSTWTYNHIKSIWNCSNVHVVYPPCDCATFLKVPRDEPSNEFRMVSVGQFRPEKDHKKQIDVVKAVLDRRTDVSGFRLVTIGSCRDNEDHQRVEDLKRYAQELGISDHVEFLVNTPFKKLQEELGHSTVAIHTMWNEHFGISLVECMSAGCIMVAHRSGGPLMDIVVEFENQRTGYLADSVQVFADCIINIIDKSGEERNEIITAAKKSVCERFSVETFQEKLVTFVEPIMNKLSHK